MIEIYEEQKPGKRWALKFDDVYGEPRLRAVDAASGEILAELAGIRNGKLVAFVYAKNVLEDDGYDANDLCFEETGALMMEEDEL